MDRCRRRTARARILVVEDHEDFRTLLEMTLQDAGYDVDSAASSEDALRMLNASPYALVVTDYSLPGHSGAWLLAQASRHRTASVPALIVTGDPDAPGIPRDVPVVRKPMDIDRLLAQVRAAIGEDVVPDRARTIDMSAPPPHAPALYDPAAGGGANSL
jgi:DNA-binding response OmpR family regulator